jgi:hypothetical protein
VLVDESPRTLDEAALDVAAGVDEAQETRVRHVVVLQLVQVPRRPAWIYEGALLFATGISL